jgi:hypothetical protein
MSFAPKSILNWAFDWMEWFYRFSLFLIQFLFCRFRFWLYHSCIHSLQDMVLYKVLIISGESRVFLITLGLQPYIHKEFNFRSCFLFDWTYLQCCPVFVFVFDTNLLWRQYCGSYLCQIQVGMVLYAALYDWCF